MSTTKANPQEHTVSLANYLLNAISRSFTLGVDEEGCIHHYYQPADAVVVYDGRNLEHYQPLAGRSLQQWHAFVDRKRGWHELGQFASLGLGVESNRMDVPL